MKKLYIFAALSALIISNESRAGDIYISPSLLLSQTSVDYDNKTSAETVELENDNVKKNNAGLALDLGYRGNFGNFFIGPELFFNQYNTEITDFKNVNNPDIGSSSIKINKSYGLALNFGYKFTEKFALYARLGAGAVSTDVTWYNLNNTALLPSQSSNDSMSISSLGALYYLNSYSALKIAYDHSEFRINRSALFDTMFINNRKASFNVSIDSLSLGMLFKF